MTLALTDNEGRLVRDLPNWPSRSALTIEPGKWRMRNGHTAEIQRKTVLKYMSGQSDNLDDPRKERTFIIWYGRCVECNEAFGWNANGTYAANGKNPLDILERLP